MRKNNFLTGVVTLIVCMLFTTLTMAETEIDTSFGQDGLSLQDFKIGDDEAYAIAVQEDGKILVAGYSSNGAVKDLIVSRFLTDGALDTEFNDDGVFTSSLGSGDTIGRSLVVQENGNIIIVGSSYDGTARIAVLKITPEGYLDSSFAADGYVILPVDEGDIVSTAVQLSATGDIVVSATVSPTGSADYAFFARINNEGQLDDSFSDDGRAVYKDRTNDLSIHAITVLGDGKILGGGSFTADGVTQAGLLGLNADGTVDSSYATDGKSLLTTDVVGSVIHSMIAGSDGSIIIAGALNNGDYNEAFVGKVKNDGTIDADFGTSGIYKTTYSTENVVYSVTLQDDNRVSAVGFMTSQTGKDFFVLTLQEDTATQTTAVTYIASDIAKDDDIAYAAAALDNGKLLAAGSSSNGEDLDVALLRFAGDESLSSSSPTDSSNSSSASEYRITTTPVTEVTRVAALSGGSIIFLKETSVDTISDTCAETCESECSGTDNECYTSCTAKCNDGGNDGVTVTKRGVVYGTTQNPTISAEETEDDNATDGETATNTTDNDAANETPSSENIADSNDSEGSIFPKSESKGSIFPESINYSIVRSGSTENGSGTGSYTSEISNITPGTLYYVRAYAVLSNGEVIYGEQVTFSTDDACFIATAAYGSILEKHVVLLRQFRDSYLLTNSPGQHLVALYYTFSPPIADIIRDNSVLQTAVRVALFPAVLLALFFVKTSLMIKLLCLAAGLACTLYSGVTSLTSQRVSST